MAHYLFQLAYTPEAWAALIKNPSTPLERVQAMWDELGGRSVGMWYAFGEFDLIGIVEFPDNVSVAASSLKVAASGAVKALQTTPLLTLEEGLEAMKKAGAVGYRPPS